MGFSIKKMKQPSGGTFLKVGKTFFRVKRSGETIQDFKTKTKAKSFILGIKKREGVKIMGRFPKKAGKAALRSKRVPARLKTGIRKKLKKMK